MENRKHFITAKVRGVIMHEGKIFLCKLAKGEWFYCLPGGTLDSGESRKEGLKREFIEELGVEPVIGNLIYTQEFIRSDGTTTFDFWYEIKNSADFLNVDISKCSHGFEHSEVGFYDEKSDFSGVVKPDNIWELMAEWKKEQGKFVQNV